MLQIAVNLGNKKKSEGPGAPGSGKNEQVVELRKGGFQRGLTRAPL